MAAVALVAGLGLAACQKSTPQVAALPLDTAAAAPLGEAPPPGGLPPAPPARIGTLADYHDAYAYPDRAWGMSGAFGDSPPDYAFYDDGVTPWVWVADDDSECLAEPVPGGERYYYFEPGVYTPFYVQDPSYGYGFANGQLVAIYERGGREVAPAADPTAAAIAGQYLARGRLLRQAASSQPHQAVAAANWSARRGLIAAEHTAFARNATRDPAWRAYHTQHLAQDQGRFAAEAARRETWAAQSDKRIGEPARAQREQRQAQSFSRAGGPALPRVPPLWRVRRTAMPPRRRAPRHWPSNAARRHAPPRSSGKRASSAQHESSGRRRSWPGPPPSTPGRRLSRRGRRGRTPHRRHGPSRRTLSARRSPDQRRAHAPRLRLAPSSTPKPSGAEPAPPALAAWRPRAAPVSTADARRRCGRTGRWICN
jgi:hypothetical protein